MAMIAPAYVTINPSYQLPELLLPYTQASGAFNVLPSGGPMTRLAEGDLVAYVNRVDLRTRMASGQSAYNELPSVTVVLSQISAPTYLIRVRAEYDHHDTAAAGRRGVSIVEAQRLGMRQGHFQLLRTMLLDGMNPANGEGILHAAGSTAIALPPDAFGNDTVITYDNGGMAFFLAQQIQQLKSRTNQLGIGKKFVILGPQRTLGTFEYNVVQLTQFQREGAGTTSTAGTLKDILMDNGDELMWCYDDTLIGKGDGDTDAVIIIMPEVTKPNGGAVNTNEFAKLAPGLDACTLQLTDMAAPREIPTPIAGGAIDIVSELRATSGWVLRGEVVTVISMQYE
jgi:hypothetical protein